MNKNKKWLVIGIISLVLLIGAAVASYFFVLPEIQKNQFFDYIKKGDLNLADDAQKVMNKLSKDNKEDAVEMAEDLIVKETNDYLSGKDDYSSLKNILVVVENIKECWGITSECFTAANKVELAKIYDQMVASGMDSSDYADKKQEFRDVFYITAKSSDPEGGETDTDYLSYFDESVQSAYIDSIQSDLEAKLKKTYDGYVTGSVTADQLSAEADIMGDAVYGCYGGSGFANDVHEELAVVKAIEEKIELVNSDIEQKLYNEAVNECKNCIASYGESTYYAGYKSKIDELQKKAYDDGLAYYKSQFDEFVKAKDKDGAQALYDKIKDNYAEAFKIDEIIGGMKPEWADAYIGFIKDLDKNLKAGMDLTTDMDAAMPLASDAFIAGDAVDYLIADLDGNKVPELIIMGDTMSHIITYENGKAVYVATTGILATTATSGTYVTAYVVKGDKEAVENYVEFTLSGSKITVVGSAYGKATSDGATSFKVNGQDSDQDGFMKAGQDIIDKAANDFNVTGRLDEDYEKAISDYKE